jgi:hypothetical protein
MRPAAYGSGVLVGVFTALMVQQGLTARQATSEADAMVGPSGSLAAGSDPTRYDVLRSNARVASRNAYLSGGAAVVFAIATGVLGWHSRNPPAATAEPALALRF